MLKDFVIIAASAAFFLSCSHEQMWESGQSTKHDMEFVAGATTKSTVSGSDIFWESGDELSVFDADANNRFSTTQGGATTVFVGKAGVAPVYYALYPYNASALCTSGEIVTTLPKVQLARMGDFAKGANVAVGSTTGKSIEMMNLCGFLKIGIGEAGKYRKVTIFTNSCEPLSGDVRISFDGEGKPVASSGDNPYPEVYLTTASEAWDQGVYYIPVLP